MSEQPVIPNSYMPAISSVAMLLMAVGAVSWLHGNMGPLLLGVGTTMLCVVIYKWFQTVIHDSRTILFGNKVFDRSMRIGMMWFIFTEVMFFAAFFGVLFYIRVWALPQLGGEVESKLMTHVILWPDFQAAWPLLNTPDATVQNVQAVGAMGIPALNTLTLLSSGLTITVAHHAILQNDYKRSARWMVYTILLGMIFLGLQVIEYAHAISLGLSIRSGIYGSIFYMMTGFHGLHVLLGSLILAVICIRMSRGEFSKESHFGFEASAWYWHFVDVVWLLLFVFVYWI